MNQCTRRLWAEYVEGVGCDWVALLFTFDRCEPLVSCACTMVRGCLIEKLPLDKVAALMLQLIPEIRPAFDRYLEEWKHRMFYVRKGR